MMSTVPDFIKLVSKHGSPVTYHRDDSMVPCPCLTPEGFRNPEWHLQNPPGSVRLDTMTDPTTVENPPWVTITSHGLLQSIGLRAALEDFRNTTANLMEGEAGIVMFLFIGDGNVPYPAPDDFTSVTWAFWGNQNRGAGATLEDSWASIENDPGNWGLTLADLQHLGYLGEMKSIDGGTWFVWTSLPGDAFDWNTGLYASSDQDTGMWEYKNVAGDFNPLTINNPPICNAAGMIPTPGFVANYLTRAFVQPVQAGAVRRLTSEQLQAMFGEIESDDHVAFFPVNWGGQLLNFYDWGQSTEDYIEYNGRRYTVVAVNLIPDPADGNPWHHWEIGLRLTGA